MSDGRVFFPYFRDGRNEIGHLNEQNEGIEIETNCFWMRPFRRYFPQKNRWIFFSLLPKTPQIWSFWGKKQTKFGTPKNI